MSHSAAAPADQLECLDASFSQPSKPLLQYQVHGRPAFASVTVHLDEGEKVIGDGGALLWADGDVDIKTFCPNGCYAAIKRKCAGESCFMNRFTGPGYATFSFNTPGDLLPFAVTPDHGWILTQKAFIAGSNNIKVSGRFVGCCAAATADEGLFFTKISTKDPYGVFFAGGFGEIVRHDIPSGKSLYVDNGMFFAAHSKTKVRVTVMGGLKTCCCGGEGLVMMFRGPSVVYTQSRDPELWESMDDPTNQNRPQESGI